MLPAATTQFLPKVTPSRIVALAPIQVPDLISTPFLVTPCSLMGAVLSSKVVTRGGLVVALAKMSFMNEVGILSTVGRENFSEKIFNESLSVLVQINNKHLETTQKTLETNNIPFNIIGITTRKKTIKINEPTPYTSPGGVVAIIFERNSLTHE